MTFKKGECSGKDNYFYGKKHSKKTIKKISEAKKGHIPWIKGRKHTEKSRKKQSEAKKGKKASKETKMKMSEMRKGSKSASWKGGKTKREGGYLLIHCPTHPYRIQGNYVREHRFVMEAHIGRTLLPTEVVHHINGIPDDNRIENLMLFANNSEHNKHHKEQRKNKI